MPEGADAELAAVAKTPPGRDAEAVPELGAPGALGAAPAGLAAEPPPIPLTALQVPTTSPGDFETFVTSGPGSGNFTSVVSLVVHPLPRFATKSDGRDVKEVPARFAARFTPEDPVIVIDAQFMYISRLPTLLNQVHAKRAAPAGASEGTANLKEPPVGQSPMNE